MTTDLVWTITANAVFLAISIVNAWIIARYSKNRKTGKKARSEKPWFEKMYSRLDLLSGMVFLGSVAMVVFLVSFPRPDTSIQALHISMFVGYAVLGIVFYFIWLLSLRIDRHSEQIGNVVDLMKDSTDGIDRLSNVVSSIVRAEIKESDRP